MKLFYFSGSTVPSGYANSVHVMKMCAAFSREDLEVVLFGKGRNRTDIFKIYNIATPFKLHLATPLVVPFLGGVWRVISIWFNAWKMGAADIYYGRDILSLMLPALMGRRKVILELHELPSAGMRKCLLDKILRTKNLKGIVVISQALKNDFLEHYQDYKPDRILVAHDGADIKINIQNDASLKNIPGTVFQIGYGGSLYKGKGVELILKLAADMPHIGFHIMGGPDNELERWRSNEIIPENIVFYGHQYQNILQARLSRCDALIAPYMPQIHINTGVDIARWISPLKLFEYMALKKPILCSDIPVLGEIMEHERNALLAPPDNIETWRTNIECALQDEALRASLVNNAYYDLKAHYSWDIRAQNIIAFMQRLS